MRPLADQIRPKTLDDFHGQTHLVGKGKPLRKAIEGKHLFSFILWGPPGVGKTTLGRMYAKSLNAQLYELSAVSCGKEDIRKVIADQAWGLPKILFLDEIHRFNKAQQDFLLPYVESGELTLIGATTENPSFEVIAPLLSRCHVFVLEPLGEKELKHILKRTEMEIPADAADWLVQYGNGDARHMLTLVAEVLRLYKKVTVTNLEKTINQTFIRYDKKGEEHYNVISAFIKSMRASQPDAALYYLARMLEAGEDPKFIARRMVIFASEDVGMLQPTALVVVNEVFRAVETIGMPECRINLAHGVVYLSLAPKEKAVYEAIEAAIADVRRYGNLPVPKSILNAPTKLMKELGYGKGYARYTQEDLRPERITKNIYFPKKKG